MTITLSDELRKALIAAMPKEDRKHFSVIVDLLTNDEDPTTQSAEPPRTLGDLSVREKYAIAHFRALSERSRQLIDRMLDAVGVVYPDEQAQ